jgi:hypothetical protein
MRVKSRQKYVVILIGYIDEQKWLREIFFSSNRESLAEFAKSHSARIAGNPYREPLLCAFTKSFVHPLGWFRGQKQFSP